ncbi:MAG TPA: hypothetical protein VNO17_09525 [Actinomycetota bacterium]|nr:hypothetical protein [Actinomycetota bacterium]
MRRTYDIMAFGGTDREERLGVVVPHIPPGCIVRRRRRKDGAWESEVVRRRSVGELRRDLESRRVLPRPPAFRDLPGPGEHPQRYRFIPASIVPRLLRAVVDAELALADAQPQVRWFEAAGSASADFSWPVPVSGLNDRRGNAIALLASLDPDEVGRVVRHELAHLAGADEAAARRAEVA